MDSDGHAATNAVSYARPHQSGRNRMQLVDEIHAPKTLTRFRVGNLEVVAQCFQDGAGEEWLLNAPGEDFSQIFIWQEERTISNQRKRDRVLLAAKAESRKPDQRRNPESLVPSMEALGEC